MELDPRLWGPVAKIALVLLILLRLPPVFAVPTTAGAVGRLLGTIIGAVFVVGIGRSLLTRSGDTDAAAEGSPQG